MVGVGDKFGRTPLHWAVYRKDKEAIDILLDHGADITSLDCRDKSIFDEMYLGWRCSDHIISRIAKALAGLDICHQQKQAFVNRPDMYNATPLQTAILLSYADSAEIFLAMGCDFSLRDIFGLTMFHMAALSSNPDVIAMVADAHFSSADVRAKDIDGMTGADCIRKRVEGLEYWIGWGFDILQGPRSELEARAEAQALLSLSKRAASFDPGVLDDLGEDLGSVDEVAAKLVANYAEYGNDSDDDRSVEGLDDSEEEYSEDGSEAATDAGATPDSEERLPDSQEESNPSDDENDTDVFEDSCEFQGGAA